MLRFVFVTVLVALPMSNRAIDDARTGDFHQLCQWFCEGHGLGDYFRNFDEVVQPRIFCGLCKKKLFSTSTTTSASMSTTTPEPRSSTSPSSTTSKSSSTSSSITSETPSPSTSQSTTTVSTTTKASGLRIF